MNYEHVVQAIGRNRKVIAQRFKQIEEVGKEISFDLAKEVIGNILRSSHIVVKDDYWPLLLNFALKNRKIDYRFLLEIYRGRKARMEAIV